MRPLIYIVDDPEQAFEAGAADFLSKPVAFVLLNSGRRVQAAALEQTEHDSMLVAPRSAVRPRTPENTHEDGWALQSLFAHLSWSPPIG